MQPPPPPFRLTRRYTGHWRRSSNVTPPGSPTRSTLMSTTSMSMCTDSLWVWTSMETWYVSILILYFVFAIMDPLSVWLSVYSQRSIIFFILNFIFLHVSVFQQIKVTFFALMWLCGNQLISWPLPLYQSGPSWICQDFQWISRRQPDSFPDSPLHWVFPHGQQL